MVNGLRDLLFPPACLFCHESLDGASGCCEECFADIHVWPHSICERCGREIPESLQPGPCGRCLNHPPVQAATRSLYRYHGPVRDAILEWKLQGHEPGVRWLVDAAMPELRELLDPDALLLPVPMPLSRMRKSGQHHAANLCRWIADGVGCGWDWRILRRIGEQPRQSALSGEARRTNLCKAFALSADYEQRLPGTVSSIWIVDDIFTTGSTLHFAARACRKLPAPVHVLSLARTSDRG